MEHSLTASDLADAIEQHFTTSWPDGGEACALDVYLSPHTYVERYADETGDCEGPGFVARRYTAAGLLEQRFRERHPEITIED